MKSPHLSFRSRNGREKNLFFILDRKSKFLVGALFGMTGSVTPSLRSG